MAVTVDLGEMPFQMVMPIIKWCWDNDIEREKCLYWLEIWSKAPPPDDIDWTLTIPDKYATLFILTWMMLLNFYLAIM